MRPRDVRQVCLHPDSYPTTLDAMNRSPSRNPTILSLAAVVLFVMSSVALHAGQSTIETVFGRDCERLLIREINTADEEVLVAIYSITQKRIGATLTKAAQRGAKVHVKYDHGASKWKHMADLIADLQRRKVKCTPIRPLKPHAKMHHKFAVIDRKKVLTGSFNFSTTASLVNYENLVLLTDTDTAAQFIREFESMARAAPATNALRQRTQIPPSEIVGLHAGFITDAKLGSSMVAESDERAFDVALLLLRQRQKPRAKGQKIRVNYEELAKALGLTSMARVAYRRQITKTLRKLQDKYKLIKCEFEYAGPAHVDIVGKHYLPTAKHKVSVPSAYWDYGWSRKLSLKAKFLYLMCLYRAEKSVTTPWWSDTQKALGAEFGIHSWTVCTGLLELESMDLLEVERSSCFDANAVADNSIQRAAKVPNRYRLKRLRLEKEIAAGWTQLRKKHGDVPLQRARKLADLIDMAEKQPAVDALAKCIAKYGHKQVGQACAKVGKLRRDNPWRHVGYVVDVLKTEE